MEYKIPFIGDSSVGKTSIVMRYMYDKFGDQTLSTIGVANLQTRVDIDGEYVKLNIWDTAGQERYRSLVPIYIKGAHCVVLVFDYSEKLSFDGLDEWDAIVKELVDQSCQFILVANKSDLDPAINLGEIKKWATAHKYLVEFTSAKNGDRINELFRQIAFVCKNAKNLPETEAKIERKSKDGGCC